MYYGNFDRSYSFVNYSDHNGFTIIQAHPHCTWTEQTQTKQSLCTWRSCMGL